MFSGISHLTLDAPIATKVVCFSRLLKWLRCLYGKQCGPRSDCSYRSSLFWVHAVCFYTLLVSNIKQLFAADDFNRRHFQMHFILGTLRVNPLCILSLLNTFKSFDLIRYVPSTIFQLYRELPQNFSKMLPVLHHRHNAGLEISQDRHLPCITKILGFGFMAYTYMEKC